MKEGLYKSVKWVLGTTAKVMSKLRRSLTPEFIGTPSDNAGDTQGAVGGVPAGRVAWPVDPSTHDGATFIACDTFPAEYVKKDGKVYLLDKLNKRHAGAIPLDIGPGPATNVLLAPGVEGDTLGFVMRGAEFGDARFRPGGPVLANNIFYPAAGQLVAHHLTPDPPEKSSLVYDVDGRKAGLHGLMRVREWVTRFCLPATNAAEKVYALLLNFTRNGDGTPAHGAAHFRASEAVLSHEAGGPLAPADDGRHEVARTNEGVPINQGGLDISATLFGNTPAGIQYSPAEFVNEEWRRGSKGPFVKRVEWREDTKDEHTNACGKKIKGRKKWMSWSDWRTVPQVPPVPPRKKPPPAVPPPTTPPKFPPAIPPQDYPPYKESPPPAVPPPPAIVTGPPTTSEPTPPTTGTPNETESPSSYGKPVPGAAEPRDEQPPATGDGASDDGTGYGGGTPVPRGISENVNDGTGYGGGTPVPRLMPGHSFTEADWHKQGRVGHKVYAPVYRSATPGAGSTPAARWPVAYTSEGHIYAAANGEVIAIPRQFYSPGSEISLAPEMERNHQFVTTKEGWPTSLSAFYKIAGAGKNLAGVELVGGFGIGLRHATSAKPASGAVHKLSYAGAGLTTDPDYEIVPTDATGAESTLNSSNVALRIFHHLTPENEITLDTSVNIAAGNNVSAPLATIVRITSGTTLTGIDAPVPARKRVIWLVNHSGAAVTISHDATSTAANRFYCPESGDYTLEDHSGATIYYDVTLSRWCLFDTAGGGGAGGGVTGAARAYLSGSDQSYTSGSPAKIQFNAETFDVEGWFDSATNYRYTPLEAGKYRISARCRTNAALLADSPVIIIYKNGSEYARGNSGEAGSSRAGSIVDSTVDMNGTTDYLEVYFSSGANCTIYLGSAETYVDVERLDLPAIATFADATSDGTAYGRKDATWVNVRESDVTAQQAATFVLENRTSDPGAPATGQMWFRTDL